MSPDTAARRIEYVPLASLKGDPRNPKAHSIETIESSYERFGVVDVITMDSRTGFIVSGHGRTASLRSAHEAGDPAPQGVLVNDDGSWLVPVVTGWASKNDAEAAAALIAMNRVTELGGWVDEALLELLSEITESGATLEGVGFSETDLDDLRALVDGLPSLDQWQDDEADDKKKAKASGGGGAAVSIKLTDAGAIAAWHETRDLVKSDDAAARILFGLESMPAQKAPAKKPRRGRTGNPTLADLDWSSAQTVPGAVLDEDEFEIDLTEADA